MTLPCIFLLGPPLTKVAVRGGYSKDGKRCRPGNERREPYRRALISSPLPHIVCVCVCTAQLTILARLASSPLIFTFVAPRSVLFPSRPSHPYSRRLADRPSLASQRHTSACRLKSPVIPHHRPFGTARTCGVGRRGLGDLHGPSQVKLAVWSRFLLEITLTVYRLNQLLLYVPLSSFRLRPSAPYASIPSLVLGCGPLNFLQFEHRFLLPTSPRGSVASRCLHIFWFLLFRPLLTLRVTHLSLLPWTRV